MFPAYIEPPCLEPAHLVVCATRDDLDHGHIDARKMPRLVEDPPPPGAVQYRNMMMLMEATRRPPWIFFEDPYLGSPSMLLDAKS
jgi:hypothetical protein